MVVDVTVVTGSVVVSVVVTAEGVAIARRSHALVIPALPLSRENCFKHGGL